MAALELIPAFESDSIDVIGQQPLAIYTQITLCYWLPEASLQNTVVNILTKGLQRLSTSFPWVAGQVVKEDANAEHVGLYKLKPLESIPRFTIKDLTNDSSALSMYDLREDSFPFSMLDEGVVAPRNTIPSTSGEPIYDDAPVFLVQATFIDGGLLLTFNGQHQTMDMTGQGQIISLLSKACRNEEFTNEELASGNLSRRDIIPLLDDSYEQGPELADQTVRPTVPHPTSTEATTTQAPPQASWRYFTFSASSLAALKALATDTLPEPSSFVSTDDTLTAFIWQSISRARLPRLNPAEETAFARAVDVRRYLDIPATYPGLTQNMTYHRNNLQQLVDAPLGEVAAQFRAAVDPKTSDLAFRTRALATVLSRSPNQNNISFTASMDLSKDLMLSSWAKIDCYDLDFGLGLGKPEAVRRPQFIPFESLLYLMPRRGDGEIAAALCLRHEDMERLRSDEEFTKYGHCV